MSLLDAAALLLALAGSLLASLGLPTATPNRQFLDRIAARLRHLEGLHGRAAQ